jgi:four helix bundle protein
MFKVYAIESDSTGRIYIGQTNNISKRLKMHKRRYVKAFVNKISDCLGEASETEVWLDMSLDLAYINKKDHYNMISICVEIEKMLNSIINNPEKFCYNS